MTVLEHIFWYTYFSFWNTLFSEIMSDFWVTVTQSLYLKNTTISQEYDVFCPKSCLFQNQTACSKKSKYSLWLIDLLTSFLMSKMSVSELLKNTKPWKTLLKTLLKGDSQNLRLINGRFPTLCSHFFANYMTIFHKTEVQTVILRCCMGLYLNWFNSYDRNAKKRKKTKYAKTDKNITQITSFLQTWKKMEKEIFAFYVITFEPIKI